jgi:hypothetical protein
VPQPPKPEFSRLNTHNGATHRSKCSARTAAPVAGSGHCTGCIWATAGPLHATAGSQEEPNTAVDMGQLVATSAPPSIPVILCVLLHTVTSPLRSPWHSSSSSRTSSSKPSGDISDTSVESYDGNDMRGSTDRSDTCIFFSMQNLHRTQRRDGSTTSTDTRSTQSRKRERRRELNKSTTNAREDDDE